MSVNNNNANNTNIELVVCEEDITNSKLMVMCKYCKGKLHCQCYHLARNNWFTDECEFTCKKCHKEKFGGPNNHVEHVC